MRVSTTTLQKLRQDCHLSILSHSPLNSPLEVGHQKVTHMISRAPSSKPKTYYQSEITQRQRIQPGISDLDNFRHSVSIYPLAPPAQQVHIGQPQQRGAHLIAQMSNSLAGISE